MARGAESVGGHQAPKLAPGAARFFKALGGVLAPGAARRRQLFFAHYAFETEPTGPAKVRRQAPQGTAGRRQALPDPGVSFGAGAW